MDKKHPTQIFGSAINRIADVMAHCQKFQFRGAARLAADAGVSPSTVTRLLHGEINPSHLLMARITTALEAQLGRRIDPRDLVAESGAFLTQFVCNVVGCSGCLPDAATNSMQEVSKDFVGVKAGQWVTSKYPRGFVIPLTDSNE